MQNQTLRANISANSKQNSKIFQGVNLGPRDNRLTKKTEGRKSRDTVPLIATDIFYSLLFQLIQFHFCESFLGRFVQ
jgi:hypothetical protein